MPQSYPSSILIFNQDIIYSYAKNMASLGHFERPVALARPKNSSEVVELVRHCEATGLRIVSRGAGTGLTGAANAVENSSILSFERMSSILEIDSQNQLAVVQPGVVNSDLRNECRNYGLWYPPEPASADISTIGGNVATNAGGLNCIKYGVTRDYVLALEVVVSGGRKIRLGGRSIKNSSGYDLKDLFIGSGGTLGVITEITVRLRPPPGEARTILGYFDSLHAAGEASQDLITSGVVPSCFELVDRACLDAVSAWKNVSFPNNCEIVLFAQVDTLGDAGEAEADQILSCFKSAQATWAARSEDQTDSDAFFEIRKLIYPALERYGEVLTEDICVPRNAVAQMLARIQTVAESNEVNIYNIAHIGDGNNHPMAVVPQNAPAVKARYEGIFEDIVAAALELGGTASGEHGVGLLKKRSFAREVGDDVLDIHQRIKAALDPLGTFNPTKIFG